MNIFQALKRHPELGLIFLGSVFLIFALLDGPLISYALSDSAIGKIFKKEAAAPAITPAKIKSYNTISIPKNNNQKNGTAAQNNSAYNQDLLTMPALGISSPIAYSLSNNENDIQKDLEKGLAHFNNTAMPGEKGKILIIGHSSIPSGYQGNYGAVFTALNDLKEGGEINIYSKNKRYIYKVFKKEITKPILKNLDERTEDSILILMTCWPPGTAWKRLFVYAKLTD